MSNLEMLIWVITIVVLVGLTMGVYSTLYLLGCVSPKRKRLF